MKPDMQIQSSAFSPSFFLGVVMAKEGRIFSCFFQKLVRACFSFGWVRVAFGWCRVGLGFPQGDGWFQGGFEWVQWLVCCARLTTPSRLVFVSRAHTPKAGKIRARVLSRTRSALTELCQPHFDGSPLRTAAMLPLVFEGRRRRKSCNRTLCETRCSGFAFTSVRQAHVGPRAAGCVSACANRWR